MTGIYLQGGGAKGAYQAGVIYALHEMGMEFNVVTGTSIGAINGYFIHTGQYEEMKKLWIDVDESQVSLVREEDNIIENVVLIDRLRALVHKGKPLDAYYVNYVDVFECRLYERYDDLTILTKDEALERIRYSALLPKPRGMKLDRIMMEELDTKYLFERFKEELIQGEYNDMSLDGGILNNHFLQPFEHEKVDKLILVPFQPNYILPEFILNHYSQDQLIVIDPVEKFLPMDTLRFDKQFCNKIFNDGYKRAFSVMESMNQK